MGKPTVALPNHWRQVLLQSDRQDRLKLLPQIELLARPEPNAYEAVLALYNCPDFALRLRALLAIGRLGQAQAAEELVALLKQEQKNLWRLCILDTLHVLPLADKLTPLLPLLTQDQPGDDDAYFLGGLTWLLGQQGEAAIRPLSQSLLHRPARGRRLKDSLLFEAFWLAAQGQMACLQQHAAADPPLWRFLQNRVWPPDCKPHFGIFPNPDYLLEQALAAGLSQKQFKQLFFWHRHKNSLPPPQNPA